MIEIEKRAGEWSAYIDGDYWMSDVDLQRLLDRLAKKADEIEWTLEDY